MEVNSCCSFCKRIRRKRDHFGRLPDSLVLVIFDKVADARSLVRCSRVSKRFRNLVPLVHDVFLKIDWPAAVEDGLVFEALSPPLPNNPNSLLILLKLMLSAAYKNYQYFPDANVDDDGNKTLSARQALRNFTHVRNLKIELPPYSPGGGGLVTRDGHVLKWRVEFGSTLQSCLLVAATGMEERNSVASAINQATRGINRSLHNGTFFTNSEWGGKLRFALAYGSALIASMRHYQLVPIIMDHPTLRSVVFTDADGLGTLIMGKEQLKDCRENPPQIVPSLNSTYKRTGFPKSTCRAKSTCAQDLELPGGLGRHKAAIVVCKPVVEGDVTTINEQVEELLVSGAFEGPFVHFAKALLRKRN